MELPSGIVFLRDSEGGALSEFWQYGFVNWEIFYSWLQIIIVSEMGCWAIFEWDVTSRSHGKMKVADRSLVDPGSYILLAPDGSSLMVGLSVRSVRARKPTIPDSATMTDHYRTRVRNRDLMCLVTGMPVVGNDDSRFEAVHIFPRGYDVEWTKAGYPSLITDPAPLDEVGGPSKIDSIQNIILLRSDLREAWDKYKFGVNPDAGYIVIPFIAGYDDIAGKTLKLDHITDPNIRPLDDLLRDHLLQCVHKNVKGMREPQYEESFSDGALDLSRTDIWGTQQGRSRLESELRDRLGKFKMQQFQ